MSIRRAFGIFLKAVAGLFVAYCIVTTIRVWVCGESPSPQFQDDRGWLLLLCSISLSILRRWLPLGGRILDLVYECLIIVVHIVAGLGMHRSGPPSSPSPPEAS